MNLGACALQDGGFARREACGHASIEQKAETRVVQRTYHFGHTLSFHLIHLYAADITRPQFATCI
jgi:hypothetical protein